MQDKWDAIHSFRVGGAAKPIMDATAMDVLMSTWTSATVTRRYVGVTAAAASAGGKHPREIVSIEADALSLSEQFARSCTASPMAN